MASLAVGLIETVVLGSKTASAISTVGTNLLVSTITTTTSSIGNLFKFILTNNSISCNSIINQLFEIDLEFIINILEQLVKEQENKQLNESVKKALFGLNQILELVHSELNQVKIQIEYHKTKYFNSYRSCDINLDNLKKYNHILKNRYNILVDLLKIYN